MTEIYTAWASTMLQDEAPWLISAYDDTVLFEHNGAPEFYLKAVAEAKDSGFEVRELTIKIPNTLVWDLFKTPEVNGVVDA